MKLAVAVLLMSAACYPGVDNADCAITCGTAGACPDNLSCVAGFCVAEGQVCTDSALAAAYSFETVDSGTIADLSGNGNTIRLVKNPMLGPGHTGMALSFNGTDQFAIIDNSPSLEFTDNAFTVEMWVFYDAAGNNTDDVVISKQTGMANPRHQWGIEVNSSGIDDFNLFITDARNIETGPYAMDHAANRFVYIAYTYDGVTVAGYQDGVAQNIDNARLDQVITERHEAISLGADNGPSQFFTGSIDDLRIYRRALTPSEVLRDMAIPVQ